jgi:hypothetical protein
MAAPGLRWCPSRLGQLGHWSVPVTGRVERGQPWAWQWCAPWAPPDPCSRFRRLQRAGLRCLRRGRHPHRPDHLRVAAGRPGDPAIADPARRPVVLRGLRRPPTLATSSCTSAKARSSRHPRRVKTSRSISSPSPPSLLLPGPPTLAAAHDPKRWTVWRPTCWTWSRLVRGPDRSC